MHVCIICEEFPPAPHGGTGSSYRDLAEGLLSAGHRATVIGISTTLPIRKIEEDLVNGVRIIRIPRAPRWTGTRLRGWLERRILSARLRSSGPFDVTECSDYNGWLPRGALPGVPNIIRIRGSNLFFDAELGRDPQRFEHAQERATLARATHLASVSRYAADRTLALAGLTGRTCEVIPNGVDAAAFSPSPTVQRERGLIAFVNSLNPKKGIEQLLVAVNELLPTRPDARLVVIGEDTQPKGTEYLAALRERISPDLRARVEFTGRLPREEVAGWLRRASVVCLPSHMETFGIAALEAMSTGCAVVFTRLGPGPEIVEHEMTGLLCDPFDPSDIAHQIARLLNSPGLAESLGAAARARVLERFDKRGWVARNVAFYERCRQG
jgi:glycosyltransferase involved in cell wall biosynthesis